MEGAHCKCIERINERIIAYLKNKHAASNIIIRYHALAPYVSDHVKIVHYAIQFKFFLKRVFMLQCLTHILTMLNAYFL